VETLKIISGGIAAAVNWVLLALYGIGVFGASAMALLWAVVFAPKCALEEPGCASEAHHPHQVFVVVLVIALAWAFWISWFLFSSRISEGKANRAWLPLFWAIMAASVAALRPQDWNW